MKKILWGLSCCLVVMVAQAEIYKWVDKDGVVHYADTKPQDETLEVKAFAGSPIQIDDRGMVVQVNDKPAPVVEPAPQQKPLPEPKPGITLDGLLAYVKAYVDRWWGEEPQKVTPPPKATAPAKIPTPGPASPATVVISNENMGEVLAQIERDKQLQQENEEARARQKVEIFTAPWCGYCKKAIVYLQLNKVAYEEYDISTNASAALRQKMLGGSGGVPFAIINGEKISGWSQQAYARALGLTD